MGRHILFSAKWLSLCCNLSSYHTNCEGQVDVLRISTIPFISYRCLVCFSFSYVCSFVVSAIQSSIFIKWCYEQICFWKIAMKCNNLETSKEMCFQENVKYTGPRILSNQGSKNLTIHMLRGTKTSCFIKLTP